MDGWMVYSIYKHAVEFCVCVHPDLIQYCSVRRSLTLCLELPAWFVTQLLSSCLTNQCCSQPPYKLCKQRGSSSSIALQKVSGRLLMPINPTRINSYHWAIKPRCILPRSSLLTQRTNPYPRVSPYSLSPTCQSPTLLSPCSPCSPCSPLQTLHPWR